MKRIFPQGLIVASENRLVNFVYNSSNQTYEIQVESILSGIIGIVNCDGYIFISTKDEVVRFNSKFEETASKKFGRIGALSTDNKNIFVSADNSFIALDKNLRELSRVELDCEGCKKNAHDILIYKNTAYLLDNKVRPLFLFRVNIKDLKNIRITEQIKFEGVNAHLDGQWLNPEFDQWIVIQSYCHQGGYGQILHVYPMNKGKKLLFEQDIFSGGWRHRYYDITHDEGIVKIDEVKGDYVTDERIIITLVKPQEVELTIKLFSEWNNIIYTEDITLNKNRTSYLVTGYDEKHNISIRTVEVYSKGKLIHKGSFYKEKGFKIRCITTLPPIWAIVQDKDEKYYLAQVKSKNNEISFSTLLELDFPLLELDDIDTYSKIIIKQKNDFLFVTLHAYEANNQIPVFKIIDTREPIKIIHSEDLRKFNIRTIIDILPY